MEIKRKVGNEAVLSLRKTAYLCSRNAPRALGRIVEMWVDELKPDEDCVLCSNHSPSEKAVFSLLLEHKIPAVLVLAEAMKDTWGDNIRKALDENRLLIITHCDDNVHRITASSAFDRNRLMLSMADDIIVGYCEKGGNLDRALKGYGNVAYILNDNGERPAYYVDPVELYGKVDVEPMKTEKDPWERSVKAGQSTITLGFAGSGEGKFVKIVQVEGCGKNAARKGKINLGRSEFVKFCDVLKRAFDALESGAGINGDIYVASLSGDVTFNIISESGGKSLTFTQKKDLGPMGMRSETVAVDLKDMQLFYDVLMEAQQHFLCGKA